MSDSYIDEILQAVDALRESIPPEATEEDREMLAELAAKAADFRRHDTAKPPARKVGR